MNVRKIPDELILVKESLFTSGMRICFLIFIFVTDDSFGIYRERKFDL